MKNGLLKGKGLELGRDPRIKLVEYPPPLPRWDCASFLETMLKGEPILTVENSNELIFFFPNNTVERPGVDVI